MRSLDPAVKLLAGLLVIFTFALFLGEWWFKADSEFYQTLAGLVSGISGALLMRITGHSAGQPTPGQSSQTHTTIDTQTPTTPTDPPKPPSAA